MKRTVITILLSLFFSVILLAQENSTYTVTVRSKKGATLSDIKVWLKEKTTGETITKRTNSNGFIKFSVPEGYWSINLVGLPNHRELKIRKGAVGEGAMTLTYDLKSIREEAALMNARAKLQFKETDQTDEVITQPKKGFSIVKIKLGDNNKMPVKKMPVDLVSVKQAMIYKSNTKHTGIAKFIVPIGEKYAIDVDGVRNFSFTRNLTREGISTYTLVYERTTIVEHLQNDTVTQEITTTTEATSARVLLDITVRSTTGDPFPFEHIYMQQLSTGKVYKAKTDADGKVIFLLPKGEKYMLHFDFQRDVDVYSFLSTKGIGTAGGTIVYRPDPRLQFPERYLPTPEDLFLEEFESFITKNLPEPKEKKVGLFLKWGNDKVNAQSEEAVLRIGISGTDKETSFANTPNVNLAFVLDRSGSMAGYDRIESLKESMVKFVDKLRADDKVSLITFSEDAFLELPLQRKGDGKLLKKYIGEIEAGGGTNIYNGMVMGYEQLLGGVNAGQARQLVLLTDGYGTTEPKTMVEKSKEYTDKGIGISAIGVGEGYNSALLNLLTLEQGGMMEHASESKDIHNAFDNQLSNLIFPIASDAKLEIIFNDKIKFRQLYGVPVKSKSADKITIELGNLYKGYNKVALAQFNLNKPDESIEKQPVVIALSYYDLETKTTETISEKAILNWEPATGKFELLIEREEKKLYAIAIMNQSIKVMVDAVVAKDFDKAKTALKGTMEQVKELFQKADDEDIENLVKKMTNYVISIDNYLKKQKKFGKDM